MTEIRCVYVISSAYGPVKVGISDDPDKRIRALATASPFKLTLSFVAEAKWYPNQAADVERAVHAQLAAHALQGEWFSVPVDAAIDAVKSAMRSTAAVRLDYDQKHMAVSSVYELDGDVREYWPISIVEWKHGDDIEDVRHEKVLARLTLDAAKDLMRSLALDIERAESALAPPPERD